MLTLGNNAAEAWRSVRQRSAEEPVLTQWDVWGNRVDRIELTRAWRTAQPLAARFGLVAAGHEPDHVAPLPRVHQFALVYLVHCASEFYTCPLAMSDGAATALKAAGNAQLGARALPHLLSRDPAQHWISGQWMTETSGGSDVSASGTVARLVDGQWRLYGRKWFTSAINANMALALARPEGAGVGADGLALFYLEPRDAKDRWQNISLDRLKRKLGTRELPTAEIHLDGAPAQLVGEAQHGVRAIAPMLNVTRTWNAVCALATMRRAIALATDYAQRRSAFGRPLIEQPLHRATLANLQAQFEAAFHLTFHVAELLGLAQTGQASTAQQGSAAPADAVGETVDWQARRRDRLGSLRMFRRCGLPRRQRHAATAARRTGVSDLGGARPMCSRWIFCVPCAAWDRAAQAPTSCSMRRPRYMRRCRRPIFCPVRGMRANAASFVRACCNRSRINATSSKRTRAVSRPPWPKVSP